MQSYSIEMTAILERELMMSDLAMIADSTVARLMLTAESKCLKSESSILALEGAPKWERLEGRKIRTKPAHRDGDASQVTGRSRRASVGDTGTKLRVSGFKNDLWLLSGTT